MHKIYNLTLTTFSKSNSHLFKRHPDQEMCLPRGSVVKNLPTRAGGYPWVGKIAWRKKWPPTPVFLPGKFRGQRTLVGYSPWDRRVGHKWLTEYTDQEIEHCLYPGNLSVLLPNYNPLCPNKCNIAKCCNLFFAFLCSISACCFTFR